MSGISPDDPDFQYLCVDRKKLQQEQTQPFDGKKNIWIADEKEGFIKAEIQSTKGDDITVLTEKMEVGHVTLYRFTVGSMSKYKVNIGSGLQMMSQ